MDWNASWIWHPAVEDMDNFYMHARRAWELPETPEDPVLFVTASSLYKLYINGRYVGRGPNPTDPSRYYYDAYEAGGLLRAGRNVVAALCYNYGRKSRGILGQNWGPGGFLLELRAPGRDGDALLVTDGSWRVLQSPARRQDVPLNCTLYGDFKEAYDSRREPQGWTEQDFDDAAWLRPEVLGRPPVEPWTRLVEREIPFLRGERVRPVNAFWESASVTYSWRDDWEVYDEWSLAADSPHSRPGHPARIQKTHEDFDPSLILDFGRDVTGCPEITVAGSAGGVFDVLYGEGLFLTRVDTFVLRGGRQVLQPFNRRTFRYMKLLFRETPAPVELADVSMEMETYPVENKGSFSCSDPLLNRIWEVGRYTMRMSMLDHFVDCPWRERTLYGGDMFAENLIAHYAFGDPRMNRKCLRQMAHIQHAEGALPPYGPYRGCDGFYPAWSAYWGLDLLDHYDLSADAGLLDELWPNLRRLLDWAIGQMQNEVGLIGRPGRRTPKDDAARDPFRAWMEAEKDRCEAWDNFPFYVLLRRASATAGRLGKREEAERYADVAAAMKRALVEGLVDEETGLCFGSTRRGERRQSGQYVNALLLWSGIPEPAAGEEIARRMFTPEVSRIDAPFHGLFVLLGLYAYGREQRALDFIREYWGDMLARGATTWWDSFSLDWPPGVVPERGTSLCHGWAGAPTYVLPAYVLGVRALEPGFSRILIEPRPADLQWASGDVPTPHGPVRVSWSREPEQFRLQIQIPEGCTARASLPPGTPRAKVELDGRPAAAEVRGGRAALDVPAGEHVVTQR